MSGRHRLKALAELADRRFVLATDLDGTFLGGSLCARRALYRFIEANRTDIGLVFVTGRDPAFIAGLCARGEVPWPDYVIADVGTTIAAVKPQAPPEARLSPLTALEEEIAARWQAGGPRARNALDGHPGLSLQPADFRYRLSYDLDPACYCPSAEAKVAALGLDHLISDNRFFDVLPRGVSKGPTLRRLMAHLGVEDRRVLVAGDTLNDFSMLASGLPGVVVGGAERALVARLSGLNTVYGARRSGAGGILEAIAIFNLFPLSRGELHAV